MIFSKLRFYSSTLILGTCIFLQGCGQPTPKTGTSLIDIFSSPAAQAWLEPAYGCARQAGANLQITDPGSAEIILQIGEPASLTSPAYQIDMEEVLVAVNKDSTLIEMELEQVRALFAGQGDPSLQIWVYPEGYDLQVAFDRQVMGGKPVSSNARLAVSPQHMADMINTGPEFVGILTHHWMPADARLIYSLGQVPVLAITKAEVQVGVREIIACLQK